MQEKVKNALVLLLALAALLAVLATLTNALPTLQRANPVFFALGVVFFIGSVFVWLFSWAWLLKRGRAGFGRTVLLGWATLFAGLTPVQVGAEVLRILKLKEVAGISYHDSLSAAMMAKGLKFLFISLVAATALFAALLNPLLSLWIKAALFSGFAIVLSATAIFLLPLRPRLGLLLARLLSRLGRVLHPLARLSNYFLDYSAYLKRVSRKKIIFVSALSIFSLSLEFGALAFSLLSAGVTIPLFSAVTLFAILATLERTPFLPRGIGAVEVAAFAFLSLEGFTAAALPASKIGAVIIIFDSVRLVIPTLISLAVYLAFFSKKPGKQLNYSKKLENVNPE